MGVYETFAKRKRARENAGQPDVYQYESAPPFLRQQIMRVLECAIGPYRTPAFDGMVYDNANRYWDIIAELAEREIEGFGFESRYHNGGRVKQFLLAANDIDEWLSVVELCCRMLAGLMKKPDASRGASQRADDALAEINARFREHRLGFQFENNEIVRVDEQFVHGEMVKPVLHLLARPGFEKANDDFITAHRHYRAGETKDAIVAANRAFESTLKAICKQKGWTYSDGARASELMTAARKQGLFPNYLDDGLNTYIAMMKTGLPNVRNNAGGHGEAPDAVPIASHMAAYAIHLTASNILLAINAADRLK